MPFGARINGDIRSETLQEHAQVFCIDHGRHIVLYLYFYRLYSMLYLFFDNLSTIIDTNKEIA